MSCSDSDSSDGTESAGSSIAVIGGVSSVADKEESSERIDGGVIFPESNSSGLVDSPSSIDKEEVF